MADLVHLLNFEKAASILGATPDDVRVLVVEEHTLPALYVTHLGYKEPFQYQLLRVDGLGRAFDMASGGLESTTCTGFLRIERAELNRYIKRLAVPIHPEQRPLNDATDGATFESLLRLIEPYINEPFANLPEVLRLRVSDAFFPMPLWDDLGPDQRLSLAEQDDNHTDPAMSPVREYWGELACQVSDVETSIEKWQLMNDRALPSEAALKETQLARLKRRLDNLKKLLKLPAFTVASWDGLTDEVLIATVAPAVPTKAKDWAIQAALDGPVNMVRRTWWDVASPFMAKTLCQERCTTAKALYNALGTTAGQPNSPFDKGEGVHRGSLIVREISQPLALKTVQNHWQKLRGIVTAS